MKNVKTRRIKTEKFTVAVEDHGDFVEIEVERHNAQFDKAYIFKITENAIMTCPGDDLADARAKMKKPW